MAITKMSNSGIATGGSTKYDDMLAGNTAYSPAAFESIASATPSSGTTVSFTSIPSTYKHLQIRINLVTNSAGSPGFGVQFNGDAASNYADIYLAGRTSGTNAVATSTSRGNINIGNYLGAVQTYPNVAVVDVLDYTSSTVHKNVRIQYGQNNNSSGGTSEIRGGTWKSTTTISSMTFTCGDTYAAGTTISLYGIKGGS